MKLFELVELYEEGGLRSDMGGAWMYGELVARKGFMIHCHGMLGGLQVEMVKSNWVGGKGDIKVSRIANQTLTGIYQEEREEENDIDIKELHIGLSEHLKMVLGY